MATVISLQPPYPFDETPHLVKACSLIAAPFAICGTSGDPLVISDAFYSHFSSKRQIFPNLMKHLRSVVLSAVNPASRGTHRFIGRTKVTVTPVGTPTGCFLVSVAQAFDHREHRDPLTGLPSRITLGAKLTKCLDSPVEAARSALLLLDLDRFKLVNDTLGHQIGDRLLLMVVDRIRTAISRNDLLVRLGGDEFAILIRSAERPDEEAIRLAERLVDLIGRSYLIDEHVITVGLSIGVAVSGPGALSPERLLARADLALYSAKERGRGRYRVFEPHLEDRANDRREIENDLRRALALRQFEVLYQPQARATDRRVLGFEALIRWRHPERGLVPPALFIPIAEESTAIVQIGEWVLQTACAEAANWPSSLSVSVNLSPVQVLHPDLICSVMRALAVSGLTPNRLDLEITEGVLLQDSVATLRTLRQLKELGIRISMDDFGTGYSSLSYLRSFPFDKVKIDQSFVREMSSNQDAAAIVRAVLGLGASLGIRVTAEGVETEEQLDDLNKEGCSELQGFLISRPIAASEVAKVLAELGTV